MLKTFPISQDYFFMLLVMMSVNLNQHSEAVRIFNNG